MIKFIVHSLFFPKRNLNDFQFARSKIKISAALQHECKLKTVWESNKKEIVLTYYFYFIHVGFRNSYFRNLINMNRDQTIFSGWKFPNPLSGGGIFRVFTFSLAFCAANCSKNQAQKHCLQNIAFCRKKAF